MISETDVHFPVEDMEIRGVLSRPEAAGDVPGVVLLHGWGPPGRHGADSLRESATSLAERGLAAMALSMRGWPDTGGDDDCGARQPSDTAAALDFLGSQPGIDASRVALCGFSQGGQVALLAAALTDTVAAVVAYYPPTDIELWGRTASLAEIRDWYVPDVCSIGIGTGPRSPVNFAADIRAPILLVHGADDTRVPTEQSRLMAEALEATGGDVTLHIVSGVQHGKASWPPEVWLREWDRACTFLEQRLT